MVTFSKIKNFVLDFFFPKFCLGCGCQGIYVCENCIKEIDYLKIQKCPACKRQNGVGTFCNERCAKCFYFDQMIVCVNYERDSLFQKLLIRYKYKFSGELNVVFGNILKVCFKNFCRFSYGRAAPAAAGGQALVVPVPIHKRKFKKRGFNQAKLLAGFLVNNFPKLELYNCLHQKDYRPEQAKLKRKDRLVNLLGSIDLKDEFKEEIKGKFIFLIDDVATTGSTLNECSKVLKKAGARYVCGIVLARG